MNIFSLIFGLEVLGFAKLFLPNWDLPPPKLQDEYWGPGEPPNEVDMSVRPFKVKFEPEMINDLKTRLKNTRYMQPSLEGINWVYGVNTKSLPKIVDYWLNKYDFKRGENHLNQYPLFKTTIQGIEICFIHVKPEVPKDRKIDVLPIYIQHGWPGSVLEFSKTIPMLTTPRPGRDFVFEVVVPYIPGFGYSSAASKIGLGSMQIAHLMNNLMKRLGFERYYVQGGDFGSVIITQLAILYPEHVMGMHSNFCFSGRIYSLVKFLGYSLAPSLLPKKQQKLMSPLVDFIKKGVKITGYFHEQGTRPDALGSGFSDSPAGLAAYVLEKFAGGANDNYNNDEFGNLTVKYTMDELLDDLMTYWAPNKISSSMRVYAETLYQHGKQFLSLEQVAIQVPSACAQFPNELVYQPETILRDRFKNLVQVTIMPRGGHFAAMEEPQLFANDVFSAVQKMREFDASKKGKKRLKKLKKLL